MYVFAIFSSLICLQLIFARSSEILNDVGQNSPIQMPTVLNIESDEDYDYVPRSTSFLRFGRQVPSSAASFLRFGRSQPPFLRFGRSSPNTGNFLRFGRQPQPASSNNFLRFGKKGEFLRFG